MRLAGDTRIFPCEGVIARPIDGGAVLVNLGTGACFELNRIGSEIWQFVERGTTSKEICDAFVERYAVDRQYLTNDVDSLCEALLREGLIEPTRRGPSSEL